MLIEEKNEVIQHISKYGDVPIFVATTLKDGYVKCIAPIKTICGAEFICSPSTRPHLEKLIREQGND